ncbi:MAG: hypothetical protein CSA66_05145 [Proteobacteria bacterium]|nr:MAG: hypothetical protein CSA66_05145 [Pseudomonadota bacterium]
MKPRTATGPNMLATHAAPLTLCAYCPSLCKHTCPVGTVDGREADTPWGLMSLVDHLRTGRAAKGPDAVETLYRCAGCGACTTFCEHDVEVADVLVAARAQLVAEGHGVHRAERFARPPLDRGCPTLKTIHDKARYERRPAFLLLPGRATITETPEAIISALSLCERLDVTTISCGEACRLDVGYELWFAGHHEAFVAQARKVHAAVDGAREIVVMSPEALYTLTHVYPRFGLAIEAELMHASEFLLPLLSGAVVNRLDARVAYHDSCHLARHLGLVTTPRQVLQRVLAQPLVELHAHGDQTWCCGGTGCMQTTAKATADRMAEGVVDLAREAGCTHIVSFSPECVASIRAVAGEGFVVEDAISLVARAVVGDGAAA